MQPEIFVKESIVDATAKEVFDWHSRLGALDRLSAPFYPEKIIQRNPSLAEGARTILKVPFGPIGGIHQTQANCRSNQEFLVQIQK